MTLLILALLAQLKQQPQPPGATQTSPPPQQKPQPPPQKPEPKPDPVIAGLKVTLHVGEQKRSPVPTAIGVNCDDRSIVEVLDLGDHLEFKGLAPGKTLCALGRGKLPPQVVEINVD